MCFVRGAIRALRFPERLRETLDHAVLSDVRVAVPRREFPVDLGDTGWPVGCDLLANAEMEAHVQEGVRTAALGRVVSLQIVAG
jgi:hypothetical protein